MSVLFDQCKVGDRLFAENIFFGQTVVNYRDQIVTLLSRLFIVSCLDFDLDKCGEIVSIISNC